MSIRVIIRHQLCVKYFVKHSAYLFHLIPKQYSELDIIISILQMSRLRPRKFT